MGGEQYLFVLIPDSQRDVWLKLAMLIAECQSLCVCVCVCVCVRACVRACVRVCVCAHVHSYIYIYIYTYTHWTCGFGQRGDVSNTGYHKPPMWPTTVTVEPWPLGDCAINSFTCATPKLAKVHRFTRTGCSVRMLSGVTCLLATCSRFCKTWKCHITLIIFLIRSPFKLYIDTALVSHHMKENLMNYLSFKTV